MKKFDKNYIYFSLVSDFFISIVVAFIFLGDVFLDEEIQLEVVIAMLPYLVGAFAVIYLCLAVYRILYYNTSGYELTEREIKCNRGVLFRKRSVLEYKNVHAINKKQNILHRLFGIAVLTVDSGSTNTSHQAEIMIIEKAKVVDSLLVELNSLKESGVRTDSERKEEVLLSDKDSLYNFTSKKKMLYSLINILSSVFFTAVFGFLVVILLSVCKLVIDPEAFGTWGQYLVISIMIIAIVMAVSSFISFVGSVLHSFIRYYKFAITKHGNDIQISYGLLERHTNTFSYDRIKAVKITQGLVQRMLGFASIKLEVIGYTNENGNDNNLELGVLVPFCKFDEVGEILGKVLPDFVPDVKQTKAVSYFPFISWFCLVLGVVVGVVLLQVLAGMVILNGSLSWFLSTVFIAVGIGVVISIFKAVSAFLNYKTSGIAINNGKITAYYGGFTKNITVFKVKNLVAAENVTTPLRQRAGITTLVMHLKTNALSNEVKVHIQSSELSEELERLLIV